MEDKNSFLKRLKPGHWIGIITAAIALFYIGYLVGNVQGMRSLVPEGEPHVSNQGDISQVFIDDLDFLQFWQVWNLIKDNYVNRPVSEADLFYGALEGLVDGLDDPYSVYFDPDATAQFTADLDGTFYGIGAEIGLADEYLGEQYIEVVAPLAGSPAEGAGLAAGDVITAVDGEDVNGWTVTEAVMTIRGEIGTPVVLTIIRAGVESSFDIEIIRGEITIDSVEWEIRNDGIAVIDIYMFNEDTVPLFQEAAQEILEAGIDDLVIDLRNNPGGLLGAAISVASYWVDGEPVVIERIRGVETEFFASGSARFANLNTVVLVNGGSASGSEILAGALQDYGAAVIIGEQTFGKGSVQEFHEFEDGSAVKITVAEWLTPLGRSINEIGIVPDMIVEFTLEHLNAEETPQIDAAIDYLQTH